MKKGDHRRAPDVSPATCPQPEVEPVSIEMLVRRSRSGDLKAFEEIYRRHVGRVHGLCRRLTGEVDRAQDLTQAAFLRAWQKLGSFREGGPFNAWLLKLTTNLVYEDRRAWTRKWGRLEATLDLDTVGPPVEARRSPDAALDLDWALDGLPAGARDVFVLHDVEGYRHEEIAEATGVSVGTSKSQLHRARRLLREALES
jgi:RNA polymerase sigma factor (sigma-70 family)